MALTFGFYNSQNSDRRYNSIQMSSIFDGIIKDGIFMSIGTSMMVKAGTGMMVTIGIGRAWFDHTWTLNDAEYPITIPQSEILQDRIDIIALETDATESVRANRFLVIKGTPSTNPVAPTLIRSLLKNQYALCYVRVNRGVTSIVQANITNRVGIGATPFVTGILQTIDIEALVARWENQWDIWFKANQNNAINLIAQWTTQWTNFFNTQSSDMLATAENWNKMWETWFDQFSSSSSSEMAQWTFSMKQEVMSWFAQLQVLLDGDVAANLTNGLLLVDRTFDRLAKDSILYRRFNDSFSEHITDEAGNILEGAFIFARREQLPFRGNLDGYLYDSESRPLSDSSGEEINGRIIFVIK